MFSCICLCQVSTLDTCPFVVVESWLSDTNTVVQHSVCRFHGAHTYVELLQQAPNHWLCVRSHIVHSHVDIYNSTDADKSACCCCCCNVAMQEYYANISRGPARVPPPAKPDNLASLSPADPNGEICGPLSTSTIGPCGIF